MSADEMRRRAVHLLTEACDASINYTLSARFRPSTYGDKYIPASSAEEVALQVIEGNASARAYKHAIDLINETYRMMTQSEGSASKPEQEKGDFYG